jgi:photosystem II stability/assembly factor-like uncharacterized protein
MIFYFFRFTLILLILCGLSTTHPQENEWERISSPVNTTLTNLSFVNGATGWASGEIGTIIKTSDGGRSWQVQNSTVPFFITDIHFIDENHGWAVTVRDVPPFNTILLRTTNGGDDWTAKDFQDSSAFMRTIFFFDSLRGFIGGSYIAETTDGGNTWTQASIDSSLLSGYPIYKFNFYNDQFGYACGGAIDIAGVIWRTTDSGKNWAATGVSADQVFDLFIFDSLHSIALSGDPEGLFGIAKIRTEDGGLNWGYEELPIFGLSFALDFRTQSEGWSASGFKFLFSSDAGETWNEKTVPDSTIIYDLQFINPQKGFAVGADGIILRYIPRPVGVTEEQNSISGFILFQNYPNPFNASTKIKFTIPSSPLIPSPYYGKENRERFISLKVYDILGSEVATLVNKELSPGVYEIEFNSHSGSVRNLSAGRQGLTSGFYFYQLQAGNYIQTKKMLLLR